MFQLYVLLLQHVVLAGTEEGTEGTRRHQAMIYSRIPFDFDSIDDEDAIFRFKFSKELKRMILPYLRLDLVQWSGRYRPPPLTAFCILPRRLAYPERWGSMMSDFGRSQSYLCSVTRDVVLYLIHRYRAKSEWDSRQLTTAALSRYASAVHERCGYPNLGLH
ncbi:hypothetical protein V1505DRAFT_371707 [Lipomyces doorenjongii]